MPKKTTESQITKIRRKIRDCDVLLTDNSQFAVALRYKPSRNSAPVVRYNGQKKQVEEAIKVAEKCKIPVLMTPELTHALFGKEQLDKEIETSLYAAVADIYIQIGWK